MKDRETILEIYETYKDLLNDRERDYFENYYYEDYNLQEIADNYEVSKSYVGKYINEIEIKLKHYEETIKLVDKTNKIKNILNEFGNEELTRKIEEIL